MPGQILAIGGFRRPGGAESCLLQSVASQRPSRAPSVPGRRLRLRRQHGQLLAVWRAHGFDSLLREAWEHCHEAVATIAGALAYRVDPDAETAIEARIL